MKAGQVSKIGALRLPKGTPPIQGPSQIGLSTLKLVFPLKYNAGGNQASQKNRGPLDSQTRPLGSRRGPNRFRGPRKLTCPLPPLENAFRRHCLCSNAVTIRFSLTSRDRMEIETHKRCQTTLLVEPLQRMSTLTYLDSDNFHSWGALSFIVNSGKHLRYFF